MGRNVGYDNIDQLHRHRATIIGSALAAPPSPAPNWARYCDPHVDALQAV
jgi:hypothetical protein